MSEYGFRNLVCPRCGYPPEFELDGDYVAVTCPECGITAGYSTDLEEASACWEDGDVASFNDWFREIAHEGE